VLSGDQERITVAMGQAHLLGYTPSLEKVLGVASIRHIALAVSNSDPQLKGRFLAQASSAASAAEAGLEVLRRVLYLGDPWPTI
jgi:hypothetical protein